MCDGAKPKEDKPKIHYRDAQPKGTHSCQVRDLISETLSTTHAKGCICILIWHSWALVHLMTSTSTTLSSLHVHSIECDGAMAPAHVRRQ